MICPLTSCCLESKSSATSKCMWETIEEENLCPEASSLMEIHHVKSDQSPIRKKKKKWGPVPSREQRHLGSRKRENVGAHLSHVLQMLVRFELPSSSSASLLWCQKPGRLKHLGLLYLICSFFSNCIPKLLAKLLKIIQLLRQIMSSTLERAIGEGAKYLEKNQWAIQSTNNCQSWHKKHSSVHLPPMFSIPINKMNKFQKHSKILIRLSESHPWIA